jgi:hypothetical protein
MLAFDLCGSLGPCEGLGVLIAVLQETANGTLHFDDRIKA